MKIIDFSDEHKPTYFACLEDWSEDMKEAGDHKEVWYEKFKDRNLGVKLAVDDDGEVCGMIQYLPIEESHTEGKDLYFIPCIWVHGYKKHGVGNRQKRGMGKALLQAAEEDVKARGAKGIAAWGLSIPVWMKVSWFKKRGYRKVDKQGILSLVWKPFAEDAEPPRWIKMKKKPELKAGRVTVTAFKNGWCPGQNITFERAKRAAAKFGDRVVFRAVDTSDRAVLEEWGLSNALFIDKKQVRTGPPPAYKKIRKKIAKKVKRLGKGRGSQTVDVTFLS